jgi:hypothetical protein
VRLLAIFAGYVGALFPRGYSRGGMAPGDVYAFVYWRQIVAELRRENAVLQARLAVLGAGSRAVAC